MIQLERAPAPGIVPGYEWREGDRLVAIGSTRLRDILDFYYLSEEEGETRITIVDTDERHAQYPLDTSDLNTFAQAFAPMEFKTCAAQCVFCFIDQNPPGMRQNIYVKDEDYRFSFLYGNYITLTSLGRRGIERVIDQKLSPLYVSVHATDVEVRTKMLGIKRRMDVMAVLRHLTQSGIEVHAQIVLCPDWNDGEVLDRTLQDLSTLHPMLKSISTVPVGLTDHREGLTELREVTEDDARDAIARIHRFADAFERSHGTRLAYPSDEFFLMVDREFPDLAYYEDMPQQDTGIGMCRDMMCDLEDALEELQEVDSPPVTATILTGTLAARFMERDLRPLLDQVPWLDLRVVGVENRLYGKGITVAGLLSGRDFLHAIDRLPDDAGTLLLPDSPINHDGVFLDDMPLDELIERAPFPVRVAEEGLVETLLSLAEERAACRCPWSPLWAGPTSASRRSSTASSAGARPSCRPRPASRATSTSTPPSGTGAASCSSTRAASCPSVTRTSSTSRSRRSPGRRSRAATPSCWSSTSGTASPPRTKRSRASCAASTGPSSSW